MVTKAKPAPEAEEEPEEKPVEITDEALTEKIKAVMKELFGDKVPDAPESEPAPDDSKPMTAREEETRTHNIVAEAINAFKEEFAGEDKDKSDKKEPESVPGKKATRWIENFLWGKE